MDTRAPLSGAACLDRSFGFEHDSRERPSSREGGLQTTNCLTCHGETLPLEKYELYNERGRFLRDVKKARQAKEADMSWLKDYVEPAKKQPGPRPRAPGGSD